MDGWRSEAKEHKVRNPWHFPGWFFYCRAGKRDAELADVEHESVMNIRDGPQNYETKL